MKEGTKMEKTKEEIREKWKKAISAGIIALGIYISAMSTKVAVYGIALPYCWKIIGFNMDVSLVMADRISNQAGIAVAFALMALISGMYLTKKLG